MQLAGHLPSQPPLFDLPPTPGSRPQAAIEAPRYVRRAEQLPLWETPDSVHLTQYRSDLLPDGMPDGASNGNCGPTSAIMALRLVGRDLPGLAGEDSQSALDLARLMATGKLDQTQWTSLDQMRNVMSASGATVAPAKSVAEALRAVRQGKVLLALGNSNADAWWSRTFSRPDVPADEWGGHFVVVSKHHPARDVYTVNDPSVGMPLHANEDQLRGFLREAVKVRAYPLVVDGPGNVVRNDATEAVAQLSSS